MALLGITPGPAVGQALDALEEEVEAGEVNDTDEARDFLLMWWQGRENGGDSGTMPELPEVEIIRRRLLVCLPGLVLREVIVNDPLVSVQSEAQLRELLAGRRVTGLRRRGKYLLVDVGAREGDAAAGGDAPASGGALGAAAVPGESRPSGPGPASPSSTCA